MNDLFSFVYVPIEFWSFDQPYISTENGLKVGLRGYIYFGAKKWLKYGYLDIIKSYIIMMSQPNFLMGICMADPPPGALALRLAKGAALGPLYS